MATLIIEDTLFNHAVDDNLCTTLALYRADYGHAVIVYSLDGLVFSHTIGLAFDFGIELFMINWHTFQDNVTILNKAVEQMRFMSEQEDLSVQDLPFAFFPVELNNEEPFSCAILGPPCDTGLITPYHQPVITIMSDLFGSVVPAPIKWHQVVWPDSHFCLPHVDENVASSTATLQDPNIVSSVF